MVVHTITNRGLNASVRGTISDHLWNYLKYFVAIVFGLVCIVPGLHLVYAGIGLFVWPPLYMEGPNSLGTILLIVGFCVIFVGVYLVKAIINDI